MAMAVPIKGKRRCFLRIIKLDLAGSDFFVLYESALLAQDG